MRLRQMGTDAFQDRNVLITDGLGLAVALSVEGTAR